MAIKKQEPRTRTPTPMQYPKPSSALETGWQRSRLCKYVYPEGIAVEVGFPNTRRFDNQG